ncbi:dTDP-glucose 4,6-dehydratase [Flavobacterium sp.]|jgi:dTDP-glucose 4,6-dehydratase|uniref:dTDP-glucose 4,6-dehydratase n=1 Tax=Flavobacterium sp. TaxID=239 RepID=UPI0037C16684
MSDTKNILITGACGFIGHHVVDYLLRNTTHNIYIIDKLSYASFGLDRLREIGALDDKVKGRVHTYIYDLNSEIDCGFLKELQEIQWIIHLAAETHVDKSIVEPRHCIMNNVKSTLNLLECVRKLSNIEKVLYFSTDEVYGPVLKEGDLFTEYDRHNPTNPYSASKSAAEMICLAYANTFNIPVIICNAMNVFGERQHKEKFIPKCINNILQGDNVYIHSQPILKQNDKMELISGSRCYIFAKNIASAVNFILQYGAVGEKYNIQGKYELKNDDLCDMIAGWLERPVNKNYIDHDMNRPNYDIRYSIDGSKLFALGWNAEYDDIQELERVVKWTKENDKWM